MSVMAREPQLQMSIASSSTIAAPETACDRIRGCFSSVFFPASRTQPRYPLLHEDDNEFLRTPEHSFRSSDNSFQAPPTLQPVSISAPSVLPLPKENVLLPLPTHSKILRLWVKAIDNFRSSGNDSIHATVQVGTTQYDTAQVDRNGSKIEWRHPRNFAFEIGKARHVEVQVSRRNGESICTTSIPISLFVPGQRVSISSPLTMHGLVIGELEVDAQLESPETLAFEKGTNLQLWDKKENAWKDIFVLDYHENATTVAKTDGGRLSAPAHSILISYARGVDDHAPLRKKIISEEDDFKFEKLRMMYDWVSISRGHEIRARCVRSGYTDQAGDMYVGRNEFGEIGKITLSDDLGPRCMLNLWCFGHDCSDFAECLVLRRGFVASWVAIKTGEVVPEGAVSSLSSSDGIAHGGRGEILEDECFFVARNDKKEVGHLAIANEKGKAAKKMHEFRCHGFTQKAHKCDVLVVRPAPLDYRDFELRVSSCEGLQKNSYGFGDVVAPPPLQPYVRVVVSDPSGEHFTWRNGARDGEKGQVLWEDVSHPNECMYFGLDASTPLDEVKLELTAFNLLAVHNPNLVEKFKTAVRKDPVIGNGTLTLRKEVLGSYQNVELKRNGSNSHPASASVVVRELGRPQSTQQIKLHKQTPPNATLVHAKMDELSERLSQYAYQEPDFHDTLCLCLEGLVSTSGGMLIAVHIDTNLMAAPGSDEGLSFISLDSGCSLELLRKSFIGSWSSKKTNRLERFKQWLSVASTKNSTANAWTASEIKELNVAEEHFSLAGQLEHRPKGGCMVLSKKGTPLTSAAVFEFSDSCPYSFPQHKTNKEDSQQHMDSRHSEAIRLAYWMGCQQNMGVVFARWEDGVVCAIFPSSCGQAPEVFVLSSD